MIETGSEPAAIAVGAGAVWVANSGDGSVSRIDPRSNVVTRAISVGDTPLALAVDQRAVWVVNAGDGTVSRIDPRTTTVVATIQVGTGRRASRWPTAPCGSPCGRAARPAGELDTRGGGG